MGLLIDLRGQRQAHRFWKRKLEIASKVTDPLSRAVWPATSSASSSSPATIEKRIEEIAVKHRQPHLFGSAVSTDPAQNEIVSVPQRKHEDPEKRKLRERQQRYKHQLDVQVQFVQERKVREKQSEGASYDGGLFRRLGENVIHNGKLSHAELHRRMVEDLNDQIRLKEERIIAEYEAGLKKDMKTESETFWRPSHDAYQDDDDGRLSRYNIRSLLLKPPTQQTSPDDRHPPWAIDKSMTSPLEYDNVRRDGSPPSYTERSYRATRRLFSESSERLDKILLDFLEKPVQLQST